MKLFIYSLLSLVIVSMFAFTTIAPLTVFAAAGDGGTLQTTPTGGDAQTGKETGGTLQTTKKGSGLSISLPNPLGSKSFTELINRIINFLLLIGAPIVTAMILWAAFQIMTAGASPENVTKGRQTILYATIGYLLLLVSKGIVLILNSILGVS